MLHSSLSTQLAQTHAVHAAPHSTKDAALDGSQIRLRHIQPSRCAHNLKQEAHPVPFAQSVDHCDPVGERPRDDPHRGARLESIDQAGKYPALAAREERHHKAGGHGLGRQRAAEQAPHAQRPIDRSPGRLAWIEGYEDVARKERRQPDFDAPRVAPRLAKARQKCRKGLSLEILQREAFPARLRRGDKPAFITSAGGRPTIPDRRISNLCKNDKVLPQATEGAVCLAGSNAVALRQISLSENIYCSNPNFPDFVAILII